MFQPHMPRDGAHVIQTTIEVILINRKLQPHQVDKL